MSARGVRRRDVERLEVVPVALDLGALGDGEAHRHEDVLELALGQRRPGSGGRPRPASARADDDVAQVQAVLAQALGPRELAQLSSTGLQRRLHDASRLLQLGPGGFAFLRREDAEGLLQGGQYRALAGDRGLGVAQLLDAREARDGGEEFGSKKWMESFVT